MLPTMPTKNQCSFPKFITEKVTINCFTNDIGATICSLCGRCSTKRLVSMQSFCYQIGVQNNFSKSLDSRLRER